MNDSSRRPMADKIGRLGSAYGFRRRLIDPKIRLVARLRGSELRVSAVQIFLAFGLSVFTLRRRETS